MNIKQDEGNLLDSNDFWNFSLQVFQNSLNIYIYFSSEIHSWIIPNIARFAHKKKITWRNILTFN